MQPWSRKFSKRSEPEHVLHVAVRRYLDMALPLDAWFTTIPTAGSSLVQGAKVKARGYRAGTPDIVIVWRGKAHWLELKAPKGTVDPLQRECHRALNRAGSPVGIARDLNDVQFWLEAWAIPLRAVVDPRQLSGARSIA
jgi:hypothetical protein